MHISLHLHITLYSAEVCFVTFRENIVLNPYPSKSTNKTSSVVLYHISRKGTKQLDAIFESVFPSEQVAP